MQKYLENEEVRALAIEQDPKEWDPAQLRDAFISLVVNEVLHSITDRVSPVKIASIQADGQIILNQGGSRMEEGLLLEVFTMGKEIFDVDTRESLGKIENLVATIEVQRVEPTMSFATVVKGDASKVSVGLVCRVKEAPGSQRLGMKPDVTRTEKGGVKLPFDKTNLDSLAFALAILDTVTVYVFLVSSFWEVTFIVPGILKELRPVKVYVEVLILQSQFYF